MKKSVEHTDSGYVIHTVNGVNTTTGAFYVREIPTFTPLSNGFNLELAQHVIAQIKNNAGLWQQQTWRTVLSPEYIERRDLRDDLVKATGQPEPSCGTAMCFAGWVGELTGANWTVDSAMAKEAVEMDRAHGATLSTSMLTVLAHQDEYILVTADEVTQWQTQFCDDALQNETDALTPGVVGAWAYALLTERGFSKTTHRLMHVADHACVQLGLRHGDLYQLFHPSNSIDDIERIVNAYAEHGVEPSKEGWIASLHSMDHQFVLDYIEGSATVEQAMRNRLGVHNRGGCSLDLTSIDY